jgi:prepilin-type processing-associated H-X9-DG protein
VGDLQIFPRNIQIRAGYENTPATVHRGGANVLFCDGHVQWFLKRDLVIGWPVIPQESAKQRMWNMDSQPAMPW